jgi:CheY-like chemotaxis protein
MSGRPECEFRIFLLYISSRAVIIPGTVQGGIEQDTVVDPKKAIVCVDDEVIILLSLKQELKSRLGGDFLYESATSAQEAFQVIEDLRGENVSVILVISDWLMPGIKGDEFLIQVRKRYPNIKSILITGQADDSAIDRALQEGGACAVIRKPWSTEELVREVRSCCMSDGGVCHD